MGILHSLFTVLNFAMNIKIVTAAGAEIPGFTFYRLKIGRDFRGIKQMKRKNQPLFTASCGPLIQGAYSFYVVIV